MGAGRNGRLIIFSGPSCVGKSPLHRALGRFYPEIHRRLQKIVLYNSRDPRPGEADGTDYHFRRREEIETLRSDARFSVLEVRGDLQALALEELFALLEKGDAFFEGNPFVGRMLQTESRLIDVERLSIFLSPLCAEEIRYLRAPERHLSLEAMVTDLMRRKLLRRTIRQKTHLSLKDLENIERRAGSAYRELREAWHFDHVVVTHDGEDSDNWEAFYYPIGDARNALLAVVSLLNDATAAGTEKWDSDLLP